LATPVVQRDMAIRLCSSARSHACGSSVGPSHLTHQSHRSHWSVFASVTDQCPIVFICLSLQQRLRLLRRTLPSDTSMPHISATAVPASVTDQCPANGRIRLSAKDLPDRTLFDALSSWATVIWNQPRNTAKVTPHLPAQSEGTRAESSAPAVVCTAGVSSPDPYTTCIRSPPPCPLPRRHRCRSHVPLINRQCQLRWTAL
jgi:hypothetical protein